MKKRNQINLTLEGSLFSDINDRKNPGSPLVSFLGTCTCYVSPENGRAATRAEINKLSKQLGPPLLNDKKVDTMNATPREMI